jgi:hypothetical protein
MASKGGNMKRKLTFIGAIAVFLFVFSVSASAALFDLKYEFDGTLPVQNYGTVEVIESGGDLDFQIKYNTTTFPLGPNADIHEFYFNLINGFTDLSISTTDTPTTPYSLLGPNPPVAGGAGASFDWGVNFGDGSGASGNGILQLANFTLLSASEDLFISDLLEPSFPNNTRSVFFAVHFQSTNTPSGSETIGAVPEPATMLLLGSGLIGFAVVGRRKFFKKG